MAEDGKSRLEQKSINYYVITGILIADLILIFLNSLEPQIDSQLDFFELVFVLGFAVPSVFAFSVAKRYWGSKIFGTTYLSLGIGFAATSIGAALFDYYQMSGIQNPFPYFLDAHGIGPDLFFVLYYPCGIYHLSRNTLYFNMNKLKKRQVMVLILIPLGVTSIYMIGAPQYASVPGSVPDLLAHQVTINGGTFSIQQSKPNSTNYPVQVNGTSSYLVPINLTNSTAYPQIYDHKVRFNLLPIVFKNTVISPPQNSNPTFSSGYYAGIYYVTATTEVFAWAVVGAQAFRRSFLGPAWGLLLAGLGLIAVADVSYYYTSIYSYDRTNPVLGIWVLGCMIVCYALHLHKKVI